jgi:hypothetical protein
MAVPVLLVLDAQETMAVPVLLVLDSLKSMQVAKKYHQKSTNLRMNRHGLKLVMYNLNNTFRRPFDGSGDILRLKPI